MERLSHSTSHHCSSSCQCSHSHQHSRSRSLACQEGDPQVTSHHGEPKARFEGPQADSCQRDATWVWTQSHQAEVSGDLCQREGTLIDRREARMWCQNRRTYQLPPPMCHAEEVPHEEANLLRPWEEVETNLIKGDEDLECPPPLKPTYRKSWVGKSPPWQTPRQKADCPPLMSMPEDPEPSPLCQSQWIEWSSRHVLMPPWWGGELMKIPGHKDYQEFTQKVHASFEVPKAHDWAESGQWSQLPANTPFNWKVPFPAPERHQVQHPGLLTHPITPYPCLCKGITTLGWEGPTTNPWPTSLSGGKCDGTLVGNGAAGLNHRGGGLHGYGAVQLDGCDPALTDRACSTSHSCSHSWSARPA